MIRWIGVAVGFLTFLVAHEIEVLKWTAWFGGVHEPWFLNSGPAIAFMLAAVCAAGGGVALWSAIDGGGRDTSVAAGSCLAMIGVLFLKPGGAGTIVPIVVAAGGVSLLAASALGAWIGRELRHALHG